jgi:two-component system response regulator AtoC
VLFLGNLVPMDSGFGALVSFLTWHPHCSAVGMAGISPQNANVKPQVMVVDDDHATCSFLQAFLTVRGYQALTLGNAVEAVVRYNAERPAAVILHVPMPGELDGLGALATLKRIDGDVPVIVLSGQRKTATIVQAMKLGAWDFISKPFVEADLEVPLANALKQRQLSRQVASPGESPQLQSRYAMLLSRSERMAEVRDLIDRVADTDVTVLLQGESGTGKELVARALYASSLRRDKPFVKVNCAALPTELLESELFGFERGAFTGAIQHKPGKFDFANHGTMFLDEISEMSPALQAKLLQVLQDGEFARLGGKHDVRVNVRIISATNRNLEHAVAHGHFREDLFFRLNVVAIHLPPLRDRREDIPLLTDYFLRTYSVQYRKPHFEISADTMRLFVDYSWPGNVRELENLVKRAVVLGNEAAIRRELYNSCAQAATSISPMAIHGVVAQSGAAAPRLTTPTAAESVEPSPPPVPESAPDAGNGNYSLKNVSRVAARAAERQLILKVLTKTRWKRTEAAAILGISYKALLYKIRENGLDKAS